MHHWLKTLVITGLTLAATHAAAAGQHSDELMFEKIYSSWTHSYDQKDLPATCSLFSRHITANYQGISEINYTSLCNAFKKTFKDPREYQYTFKIKQVHRTGPLAAVRVTWYLRISEHGKFISESRDEGLDIFQKDAKGHWKIINYLGYPVLSKKSVS